MFLLVYQSWSYTFSFCWLIIPLQIALLLTVNQHYEAASISLVASMVALFRVQQEEDEKFENEDLCVAEVQQTTRPSSPRRKRRKRRNMKKKPTGSVADTAQQSSPKPISVAPKPAAKNKELATVTDVTEQKDSSSQLQSTKPITAQSASPPSGILNEPSTEETVSHTTSFIKHNKLESRSSRPPKEISSKANFAELVDDSLSDEATITEAFDDEVAKFRARLETIQSSNDRPKIKICAGVFARQLAAKKSAAKARAKSHKSFSIWRIHAKAASRSCTGRNGLYTAVVVNLSVFRENYYCFWDAKSGCNNESLS